MTVNEILLALLNLASVLVLVLLNGFFVAAEFALVNTVGPHRPGLHGAGEHHSQMEHAA
jgi:hypothetical protein